MKVNVTVNQIRCLAVTHPKTQPDQIYLGYVLCVGRPGSRTTKGDVAYAGGKLSSVRAPAKKGDTWTPDGGLATTFDLGDATFAQLSLALYERDNGEIYNKMKNRLDEGLIDPDEFKWAEVAIPSDPGNRVSWFKAICRAAVAVFTYLLQDDLLGRQEVRIDLENTADNWRGLREFQFKAFGCDYRVSINVDEA